MEKLKLTSSARARSRAATFGGDLIKLAVMLAFVFPYYRFRPLTLAIACATRRWAFAGTR